MYSVLYVMVILYYVQCTVCDGYIILCTVYCMCWLYDIMYSVLYVMVILNYVQCTVCDCYIILCTVYCM